MSGRRQDETRTARIAPEGWEAPRPAVAARPDRCVRCAVEMVTAMLDRDPAATPGIAAMAAAGGVSPRTLQRRFAQVLGRSPRSVVRQLRLAAARQTLRTGDACSVLETALRHGFEHPGRFAIAYAGAFGEAPSVTLRAARGAFSRAARGAFSRAARGDPSPAAVAPCDALVMLRPLVPAGPADAARARRATDDLAVAIGHAPGLTLISPDTATFSRPTPDLRVEGRVEAEHAILSFVRPGPGVVLGTIREPLRRRGGIGWADRAIGALRAADAAEQVARARRTPTHRADVQGLVARARPAALSQEPDMVGMALDLLGDALHRDPVHARALALAGWSRALGANHSFTRDPEGERELAVTLCKRALVLAPDDPEVLTLAAGAWSLTGYLDEAEGLVVRSLALDPCQPEALRRLGFIANFRGDGRRGASAFRRALSLYPGGTDGAMAMIGLGVASFISGDYPRAARILARALNAQPARAWPHRFLTAAAVHAGAHDEARRSLTSLRRAFPALTVDLCARSGALHLEAKERMLDGLARAGLPG